MDNFMEDKIKPLFEKEFSFINNRFSFNQFPVTKKVNGDEINKPGVYIFYKGNQIWKVGKSLSNAKKEP